MAAKTLANKNLATKSKVTTGTAGKTTASASSKMKTAMAKRTAAHASAAQAKVKVAPKPAAKVATKAAPAAKLVTPVKGGATAKAPAPKAAAPRAAERTPVTPAAKPQAPAAAVQLAEDRVRSMRAASARAHAPVVTPRQAMAAAKPAAPVSVGLPPRPVLAASHVPASTPAPKRPAGAPLSTQLPRDVIDASAAAKLEASKKKTSQRHGFKVGEYVVYPSHGVGKIMAIEEQVVAGHALELFVINFEQEKMTLRVPTAKLVAVGMRKLAEDGIVRRAMETLRGRARVKRTMWSRRAQEYENKINSGDLISISEVVRDLYRAETQPEQSYSERQLFEAALDRMSREIAAIEKLDERGAVQKITDVLSKSARGRAATKLAEEAAAAGGEGSEGQAA